MTRSRYGLNKVKVDGVEIDVSAAEWEAILALAANATTLNALAGATAVAGGAVTFSGAVTIEGALTLPNIATADPSVAGELYSSTGTVTVSSGA